MLLTRDFRETVQARAGARSAFPSAHPKKTLQQYPRQADTRVVRERSEPGRSGCANAPPPRNHAGTVDDLACKAKHRGSCSGRLPSALSPNLYAQRSVGSLAQPFLLILRYTICNSNCSLDDLSLPLAQLVLTHLAASQATARPPTRKRRFDPTKSAWREAQNTKRDMGLLQLNQKNERHGSYSTTLSELAIPARTRLEPQSSPGWDGNSGW